MASSFTIAFPLGVTIGKWTRAFEQRHPEVTLNVVRTELDDQRATLDRRDADIAFVREPLDTEGLHLIPLYEESIVVVLHHEHLLTLEKMLYLRDIAEEPLAGGSDPESVIRRVAAGGGIAVFPQSVAKAFRRKDVTTLKLDDAEPSRVALAWPRDSQHPLVDEFIGIVRGRSAHSSRNPEIVAGEVAKREEAERKKTEQRQAARHASEREAAAKRKKHGGQFTRRARRGGA